MKRFVDFGRDLVLAAAAICMLSALIGWLLTIVPQEPSVMLQSAVKIEVMNLDEVILLPGQPPQPADPHLLRPKKKQVHAGSGTVIDHGSDQRTGNPNVNHSIILTSEHVIEDASTIFVYWHGLKMEARVIAQDHELDLALIEVPVYLPKAEMHFGPVEIGDSEWVVGYPFGLGISITSGFVSEEFLDKTIQGSASIWPGNSGGGIFVMRNGHYVLAGVAESIFRDRVNGVPIFANTVGFFVPMKKVKQFLIANKVL